MAHFRDVPVAVSVPATSANLGPGFDSLGVALDLRDELSADVVASGLTVEVEGAGADGVPRDESHLVVRAMRAAFDALGAQPPGLRLRCHNQIPHARGLGSSSAAIVGGLALARGLVADGAEQMDDDALFQLAAQIEGHPDNVAPACFGGFVIASHDAHGFHAVPAAVDARITAVAFVPPDGVETTVARGLLPDVVPHAEAAANAANAALLVQAMAQRPDLLLRATEDHLHQRYRRPAMPASLDLVDHLRSQGHAAVISGAGPTVLVLTTTMGGGARMLVGAEPDGWVRHDLSIDTDGVRVRAH